MAINTYRFWMATDANRLLANQNAFIQASAPSFYQGNVAQLELHIVASAGVGTAPVEVPFPAGAAISVAVGDTNTYPTGGTWSLMVDTTETDSVPYNATTSQVSVALNALTEVSSEGGLTVSKTGDGYSITWNTYGLKPSIGIGSDTLTPSSYESISLVQTGSAEHRQIVFVELRQNPIALGVVWTALPTPSVSVSEVQAWNGTNSIWRVTINPQPRAGTMTISYGSKTAIVAYNASTSSIASLLSPAQVFSTGQYQWDIAIAEDSVLTAVGSLVGYNGFSGSINFATAECHQFLAGAERKSTVLEVSISLDGKRYTLIQTPCNVFADVVSDGVLVPLPLGTAMSEQVANARFVRRDVDQNPDSITQDMIWQNLGVDTLGSDVVGALNLADSPSAANPFATIYDLAGLGATWGNITGTLSDQTDLQLALDNKYDASNPSNFIQEANVDGNLYGRMNGMWEVVPSLTGYATESWVTSQGYLGSTGGTVTDGSIALQSTSNTNYAYLNEGSIFFSQTHNISGEGCQYGVSGVRIWNDQLQEGGFSVYGLKFFDGTTQTTAATSFDPTGYATESWVQSQGYLTSVPPPALTGLTSDISWDNYSNTGRFLITGGSSPDGMFFSARFNFDTFVPNQPSTGDFWFNGTDFFYQGGGVKTIASQTWVTSQGYATTGQLSGYALLAGATFTGKVNTTVTATTAPINIGSQLTAPTTTVAGDVWIGANINYKSWDGITKAVANTNTTNQFTQGQAITVNSAVNAFRINQQGTGPALVVEDSVSPDATPFVIDANGKVGVGVAPDATAAIKVDANGISFNGLVFNPTATAAHTGGSDTLDLLVTINGTNYRLGLRPA